MATAFRTEAAPDRSTFTKLRSLFAENYRFGPVVRAPVIVLYAEGGQFISRHVLADMPHHVVGVRQKPLPVDLRLFAGVMGGLMVHFVRRLMQGTGPFTAVRDTLIALHNIYFIAYLRSCKPAVVITSIDNSTLFHQLAQRFPNVRFIAIQNGIRTDRTAQSMIRDITGDGQSRPEITELFALGRQSLELYERNGFVVGNAVAAGSLKADLHRARVPDPPAADHDLCLISHWKAQFYELSADPTVRRYNSIRSGALDRLNQYLVRYLDDREVTLCIALRGSDPAETAYYKGTFGNRATLFPQDDSAIASYGALEHGRLVVGMYSTLLYEAMTLGRRALTMNLLDDRQLDPPRSGPWSLEDSPYEVFRDRLDALLEMNDETYWVKSGAGAFATWMVDRHVDCPVHERLRHAVTESLAARNR